MALFGPNSYSSAYPNEEDLYISEAWFIDDLGNFTNKVNGTKGLYVSKENILYIEFFEPQRKGTMKLAKPQNPVGGTTKSGSNRPSNLPSGKYQQKMAMFRVVLTQVPLSLQ